MGTPEFAVPSLRALVAGGYRVVAVVTTPDKPAGRGQKMHESDVKAAARELGLPILQPEKLKAGEFVDAMRELRPDLGIVIAFRMLPEVIWAMPRLGTFNLHASLLPQYRGAAPINWAIINGERQTGVTTFLLNHEIDKGAILGQIKVPILDEDNVGTLYEKLMTVGTGLVLETVDRIAAGDITPIVQENADEATLHPAPKIFKEDCRIDWHREGRRIIDFIRGLSPYPAAWTGMFRDGSDEMQTAKIFAATFEEAAHGAPCGTVESDGRTFIRIACSDGWIVLGELQIAGKNASRCASSCWAGATCCNTVSNRGAGKTRSRPPAFRRPTAFSGFTETAATPGVSGFFVSLPRQSNKTPSKSMKSDLSSAGTSASITRTTKKRYRVAVYLALTAAFFLSLTTMNAVWEFHGCNDLNSQIHRLVDALLLALPAWGLRKKRWLFPWVAAVTIYLLSNVWYYRNYGTLMPLSSYLMVYNLPTIGRSLWLSLRATDLLLLLPPLLFMGWYAGVGYRWSGPQGGGGNIPVSGSSPPGSVCWSSFSSQRPHTCATTTWTWDIPAGGFRWSRYLPSENTACSTSG